MLRYFDRLSASLRSAISPRWLSEVEATEVEAANDLGLLHLLSNAL